MAALTYSTIPVGAPSCKSRSPSAKLPTAVLSFSFLVHPRRRWAVPVPPSTGRVLRFWRAVLFDRSNGFQSGSWSRLRRILPRASGAASAAAFRRRLSTGKRRRHDAPCLGPSYHGGKRAERNSCALAAAAAPVQPNVILIMTGDQAAAISSHGNSRAKRTPDRPASESVEFTRLPSGAPPTRASLLGTLRTPLRRAWRDAGGKPCGRTR